MKKFELKFNGLTGYYLEQEIFEEDRNDCGLEIIETEIENEFRHQFFFNYYDDNDLRNKLSNILTILLDK